MKQNHCGHLGFSIDTILACFDPEVILLLKSKFRLKAIYGLRRLIFKFKFSKIDFQGGDCGGHLGFSISSFSYFVSHKCSSSRFDSTGL